MGMVVRTNTMALNANRQLSVNNSAVAKSLEKLASGYRINRAGDDASGLAISEKMKAQIKGLEQASANSQDGISLIQTAEGALTEVHNMLNRMVELATKSANGTIQDEVDREAIQAEVDALTTEITRISKSTNFNGINLLDGSMGLNKDAFTVSVSEATTGEAGTVVTIDDGKFGNAEGTTLHTGSKGIAAQRPEFSVNLADYNATATSKQADDKFSAGITVGGQNIQVKNAGGNAWENYSVETAEAADAGETLSLSGEDILNDFFGGSTSVEVNIDGVAYTATKDGATGIKFTYAGVAEADGTVTADTTGEKIDPDKAIKGDVAIATTPGGGAGIGAGDIKVAGRSDCPVYNVVDPVKAESGKRSGIQLTLDANMVAVGNSLTIEDQTFNFVEWDGKSALGENEIGIKAGLTGDDLLNSVTEQLSHKSTANFNIGRGNAAGEIEIEEKVNDEGVYLGLDAEGLKGLFELRSGVTAATAATTDITIADDAIVDGNSITIGDKTYSFVSDASKALDGATAVVLTDLADGGKVSGEDAAAALAAAIGSGAVAEGNVVKVTDGTKVIGGGLTLQVGDTNDNFNKVTVAVDDLSADGLGLLNEEGRLDVSSQDAAGNAIKTIKDAINQVSTNRANMGALQNRLEYTINNLDTTAENMTAANSRIRDTDMAKEMMNYTKMNILTQAAQAMLAQANQQPQAILQLLQ